MELFRNSYIFYDTLVKNQSQYNRLPSNVTPELIKCIVFVSGSEKERETPVDPTARLPGWPARNVCVTPRGCLWWWWWWWWRWRAEPSSRRRRGYAPHGAALGTGRVIALYNVHTLQPRAAIVIFKRTGFRFSAFCHFIWFWFEKCLFVFAVIFPARARCTAGPPRRDILTFIAGSGILAHMHLSKLTIIIFSRMLSRK